MTTTTRTHAGAPPRRLLTTAEAARRLGRTPSTLRNWRAARANLPYVTGANGAFAGYRAEDLDSYLESLTVVEVAR